MSDYFFEVFSSFAFLQTSLQHQSSSLLTFPRRSVVCLTMYEQPSWFAVLIPVYDCLAVAQLKVSKESASKESASKSLMSSPQSKVSGLHNSSTQLCVEIKRSVLAVREWVVYFEGLRVCEDML
jgi:hypothetical protein